jgi:hypothetical protein
MINTDLMEVYFGILCSFEIQFNVYNKLRANLIKSTDGFKSFQ